MHDYYDRLIILKSQYGLRNNGTGYHNLSQNLFLLKTLSFSQAKRVGNASRYEERFRSSRNDKLAAYD